MTDERTYIQIIKKEISMALGCTEPAAVALTAAYAAHELEGRAVSLKIYVSEYILKNGMNVGIPGTGITGLDIAALLGAISAEPEKQLMVLSGISEEDKLAAGEMLKNKTVEINLAESEDKIYIRAEASDGVNSTEAVISGSHTNLASLSKNGTQMFFKEPGESAAVADFKYDMTVRDIVDFVSAVSGESLDFLEDVIEINSQISLDGLTHDYGLNVGKSILSAETLLSNDIGNYAVACTAAAADARMSGCEKPVMSAVGSGNQGLTATVPIVAISEKLKLEREKEYKALALSILVTIHTKQHIGRLSVLCGCSIAAAIGTCCGVIFIFGGGYPEMERGINTMVADIAGVVCDGAKPGCALKIATAVSSAIRSANMAIHGIGASGHDGIVADDVEGTLSNLGRLGNEGMVGTNRSILSMMLKK